MRSSSCFMLCAVLVACGATPAVTVVRSSAGDKREDVRGDTVKFRRSAHEGWGAAKPGFFVVKSEDDWKRAWPNDRPPPPAPTIDMRSQMLLLAVGDSPKLVRIRFERGVETAEMLYFWVRETRLGEGCVDASRDRAFDAVVTERVEKPIKFFVEEDRAESCGEAPTARIECKLTSPGVRDATWSSKLTAQPGDSVECAYAASARGKFTLVDKGMAVTDLPPGSTAKLSFRKAPDHGEFEIDVYGTYIVTAEAADEAGRHGRSSAVIEVKPPKTKDVLVQLVWTGFEIKDVSETFPRVNLRVADDVKGQRCSADGPVPGLCEVKTRGAYTYMQIPAGSRNLPVSVQYLDERAEKGPSPCVHVWYDGARTGEICDRKRRTAEEVWRVGVLDTSTGKLDFDAPATDPRPAAPEPPPNKR